MESYSQGTSSVPPTHAFLRSVMFRRSVTIIKLQAATESLEGRSCSTRSKKLHPKTQIYTSTTRPVFPMAHFSSFMKQPSCQVRGADPALRCWHRSTSARQAPPWSDCSSIPAVVALEVGQNADGITYYAEVSKWVPCEIPQCPESSLESFLLPLMFSNCVQVQSRK